MKKRGYSVTALLLSFVMALSVTAGSFSVPAFAEELETVETVETVETAEESEAINEAAEETEAAVEIEAVGEELIEAPLTEITEEEVINEEEESDGVISLHYSWKEEDSNGWFRDKYDDVEIPYEEGLSLLDLIYANFSGDLSDISGWYEEYYFNGELISSPITADVVAVEGWSYSVRPYYNKVDVQFSFLPYEEGGVDYSFATIEVNENTTLEDIVAYAPVGATEDSRVVFWKIDYPWAVSQINQERYIQVSACYGVLSIDVHFYYYDKNGKIKESLQTLEYDSNVDNESSVLERIVIPEDALEGTTYTNRNYSIDFARTWIRTCADECSAVLAYVSDDYDEKEYGLYKGGKLLKLPLEYEGWPLDGWHYGYYDKNGEWITGYSDGILILPEIEGFTEFYLYPCYAEYEATDYLLLSFNWYTYEETTGIGYYYDSVRAEKKVGDRLLNVINECFNEEIPDFDGWFIVSYDDDGNRILTPVTENRVVTKKDDFIELSPAYNKTTLWFSYRADNGASYGKTVTVDVDASTTIEDLLMYAPDEAEEYPEFEGWKFDYSGKVNADRVIFVNGTYGIQEAKVKFLYQDENGELKISEQNLLYDSNCEDIFDVVDYITIPEDAEEGAQVSEYSAFSCHSDNLYVKEAGLEAFCVLGSAGNAEFELIGTFRPGEVVELPKDFYGNDVLNWYTWLFEDGDSVKVDYGFSLTTSEAKDYDSEWVIDLFGETSGNISQETRYVTLYWEEYNEETEWFDSFEQNLRFDDDFDVKILEAIEENFTGDLSNISGWFYRKWNEETEDYEQIVITEDTTVEDLGYSTIMPFYKSLYVQFHYPSDGLNNYYGTFIDVNENTTIEDILAWAPEEAKNNPEIEGWIINYLEPNERIDSQSSLWFEADLGIQEITVALVYRGKDGKIKEDYQTFEYDTATTTEGELLSMVVIPEDAEEGTELPVLDAPNGIVGFVDGMLAYVLGDFNPIYMILGLEDSEETLGICETGDTFDLPTEYEGKKIVGWSYEYYNLEAEEWLMDECDFTFTVPETDRGIWFYPTFEEEIPDVKNGIYEEDGVLYYYENDERVAAGLIRIGDDFYYVQGGGIVSTGSYYITHGNGIMDKGHAEFGPDGKMILNGIVKIRDEYYYYENSRPVENLGLIFWNQYHYYIGEGGKAMTGMVDVVKANGIVNEGIHEFKEDGKMVLDGIIMINGKLRYYVGGAMRSQAGMIKIGDDMYYVGASAEVATGKRSVGSRHNNLVTPGMHYFDEVTGKFIY